MNIKNILIAILIRLRLYFFISCLYSIKYGITTKNKWVLGRVACLGLDSFHLMNNNFKIYNVQKGRIDFLADSILNKKSPITPSFKVLKYIKREDIKQLVLSQFYLTFKVKKRPEFLLMDSYSELTDQKFFDLNKPNSYFFANYSDIDINSFLKCDGLIPIDHSLEQLYLQFFTEFRNLYNTSPIFFIIFPKKLEIRTKFIIRHNEIKDLIKNISKHFIDFHTIEIPESIISESEDKFPYHYNNDVYVYVANEIEKLRNIDIKK
jgi:hypothetical protein